MKRVITVAVNLILLFVCVACSFAEPVNSDAAIAVGRVHLQIQEQSWEERASSSAEAFSGVHGYSILGVRQIKTDDKVLAYIIDLNPGGCIVVSSDTDIRPVIAYSFEGRFLMEGTSDNVFLHLVKWDMENRIEALPMMSERQKTENNVLWGKYLTQEKSFIQEFSSSEPWGPWLRDEEGEPWKPWHQGSPYNDYCPEKNCSADDLNCRAGCVAIAMAQIIYYWKYPRSVEFSYNNDHYVTKTKGIKIDEESVLSFTRLSDKLSDIKYDGNEDEIKALCFACGVSVQMDYGCGSSGANSALIANAYRAKFKYTSASMKDRNDRDLYYVLERNMKHRQPAQLVVSGEVNGEEVGHSLVADGFKDSGEYHLNFGWGISNPEPINECWYFFPVSSDNSLPPPNTMEGSFDVLDCAIVDIYPGRYGLSKFECFFEHYLAEHGEGHPVSLTVERNVRQIGGNWCLIWENPSGGVLVYDYDESRDVPLANQPYSIKPPFYTRWNSNRNIYGIPISDEYVVRDGVTRQDFQYKYMLSDDSSPKNYTKCAPGAYTYNNKRINYAFVDTYNRNGEAVKVGEPTEVWAGSPASIRIWEDATIQDFNEGEYGRCAIVGVPYGQAFLVRTGFWETYRQYGPSEIGAPLEDERSTGANTAEQVFEKCVMIWDGTKVTIDWADWWKEWIDYFRPSGGGGSGDSPPEPESFRELVDLQLRQDPLDCYFFVVNDGPINLHVTKEDRNDATDPDILYVDIFGPNNNLIFQGEVPDDGDDGRSHIRRIVEKDFNVTLPMRGTYRLHYSPSLDSAFGFAIDAYKVVLKAPLTLHDYDVGSNSATDLYFHPPRGGFNLAVKANHRDNFWVRVYNSDEVQVGAMNIDSLDYAVSQHFDVSDEEAGGLWRMHTDVQDITISSDKVKYFGTHKGSRPDTGGIYDPDFIGNQLFLWLGNNPETPQTCYVQANSGTLNLTVSKKDFNDHEDPDFIDVRVFDLTKAEVFSGRVADRDDGNPSHIEYTTYGLFDVNVPFAGVYKLRFDPNGIDLIYDFEVNASKLVFAPPVTMNDPHAPPVKLYFYAPAGSFSLDANTHHHYMLRQNVSVYDSSNNLMGTIYVAEKYTHFVQTFMVPNSEQGKVWHLEVPIQNVRINATNIEAFALAKESLFDIRKPTTVCHLDGEMGAGDYYISDVSVTLSAFDTVSGVSWTSYRLDSDPWQTYSGTFPVIILGDHTVEYYSTDNAGNQEETQSASFTIKSTAPQGWTMWFTVESDDGSVAQKSLTLGVDPESTTGFDIDLDQAAPPAPPDPVKLDAHFACNDAWVTRLNTDIRPEQASNTWQLNVRSDNDGFTIDWNVIAVPDTYSNISLYDPKSGDSIDMRVLATSWFEPGTYQFTILIGNEVPISTPLKAGWNMVSFPGVLAFPAPEALVPGVSQILLPFYTWSPDSYSYKEAGEVNPGKAYWVLTLADETLITNIAPMSNCTVSLKAGWNMVGSVDAVVDFSDPQDTPDGSVVPPIYAYDPASYSYEERTEIEPSQGYWVLALQDCSLNLGSMTPAPEKESVAKADRTVKPIWTLPIQLNTGKGIHKVTLGIYPDASDGFDPYVDIALPPKFEANSALSDVSFITSDPLIGRLSKDIRKPAKTVIWKIEFGSTDKGLEMMWDTSSVPMDKDIFLETGRSSVDMRAQGVFRLPDSNHTFAIVLKDRIPKRSALLQNYPNPFNPETWIPYELSEDSLVTISIYNISGQLVRKLNLGQKEAGVYWGKEKAAYWDGRNEAGEHAASGVYFYRIEAGEFSKIKKSVLLK